MKIANTFNFTKENYNLNYKNHLIYQQIPKCRICNKDLCTQKEFNKYLSGAKTISSCTYLLVPLITKDALYFRDCCVEHSKELFPQVNKYTTLNDAVVFLLDMSNEDKEQIRQERYNTASLESFKKRYPKDWEQKYSEYVNTQKYTKSQQYKGMTDEEYHQYNQDRACTLNNFIKRYGEVEGQQKWDSYVARQKFTKSKEYFGEERWNQINESKRNNEENFIKRYGEIEGKQKFQQYIHKRSIGYSQIASQLFYKIKECLPHIQCHFAPYNKEFGLFDSDFKRYYYYDFIISDIKYCIKFNGDVFHANPEIYESLDCPNPFRKNQTAQEIWDFDKRKNHLIQNQGYQVKVVWEKDYRDNPEQILNQIVSEIEELYANRRA